MSRARRAWTPQEDQLLRDAVTKEDPGNPNPSKWHAIAQHVPDRTNKDCRKRWFAKMSSDSIVKGGWSPEEDEKLLKAIDMHGTKWSIVAQVVGTRNSDQCAKRWTDTLNPSIDRSHWSPEADATLIRAVNEHGKVWTKIVKTYFPGRTGLAAKNRYNSITRAHAEGGTRNRRVSTAASAVVPPTSTSTSSASSSVSPHTPMNELPPINPGYGYHHQPPNYPPHHPPPPQSPAQEGGGGGYRLIPTMPFHDMHYSNPHHNSLGQPEMLSRPYLPPPVTTSYRQMQSQHPHPYASYSSQPPQHSHPHAGYQNGNNVQSPLDPALLPPLRYSPPAQHSNSHSPVQLNHPNGVNGGGRSISSLSRRSDSDHSDH